MVYSSRTHNNKPSNPKPPGILVRCSSYVTTFRGTTDAQSLIALSCRGRARRQSSPLTAPMCPRLHSLSQPLAVSRPAGRPMGPSPFLLGEEGGWYGVRRNGVDLFFPLCLGICLVSSPHCFICILGFSKNYL